MRSEIEKATNYFELMEGLYSMLSPFAVYDHVANGVRRKIDVDRMLTEDVRGVMAEEARRTVMVSSIQGLQASLRGQGRKVEVQVIAQVRPNRRLCPS